MLRLAKDESVSVYVSLVQFFVHCLFAIAQFDIVSMLSGLIWKAKQINQTLLKEKLCARRSPCTRLCNQAATKCSETENIINVNISTLNV